MSETYEQLRDETAGEAGQAWREADRAENNLRELYRSLKEDPRYTEEHKAEKAWQSYEAGKDKITVGKEKARELLKKSAQTAGRFSIPLPDSESLVTTDAAKLLASQNEATRIIRKIERASSGASGPFKPNNAETLKAEYGRGLEIGGMQGGAICRGVLMAADELGVNLSEVVDGFRRQRHREALERAQQAERAFGLIGTRLMKPPFPRPGSREAAKLSHVEAPRFFVPRPHSQQLAVTPRHTGRKKNKGS